MNYVALVNKISYSFTYPQVHMRSRIMTMIRLAQICSCSQMKAGILPKIQAPPIPCFTPLSSLLSLAWPRRRMTFVSWKHLVPEERSGFVYAYLDIYDFVTPKQFLQNLCFFTFQDRDQEPVVKQLISDPVEIKENHFSQPLEGSDSSRGAVNFPIPEVRYLIKEISVIWHLYGGKDFGSAPLTASPARSRG